MLEYFLVLVAVSRVLAKPFEWTALGDSYASGVGSLTYVDGKRCLRYDLAYPVQMNADPTLSPPESIFNNVVCSGSSTADVTAYQFYYEDTPGESWQYGNRPPFGDPHMATLSVGGNDIDFKGILFNCILETTEFGGTPTKTCDQQITDTWALLNSPDLVANLDALIKLTVTRGTIGDSFLLYVTGFPEFFNDVDLGCNSVTFARTANPVPDGKDHGMMTTDRRGTFNQMSVALNAAIQHAVFLNEDTGVKFIDIQANNILDGHRFCEPGIVEPDQNNPNLWLWHYPYKQNDDSNAPANLQILLNATAQITQGLTIAQLGVEFPTAAAFDDAMWNAVDSSEVATANSGDPTAAGFWDGFIGWRAKLFHPQVPYHAVIKNMIINQYLADTNVFTS